MRAWTRAPVPKSATPANDRWTVTWITDPPNAPISVPVRNPSLNARSLKSLEDQKVTHTPTKTQHPYKHTHTHTSTVHPMQNAMRSLCVCSRPPDPCQRTCTQMHKKRTEIQSDPDVCDFVGYTNTHIHTQYIYLFYRAAIFLVEIFSYLFSLCCVLVLCFVYNSKTRNVWLRVVRGVVSVCFLVSCFNIYISLVLSFPCVCLFVVRVFVLCSVSKHSPALIA